MFMKRVLISLTVGLLFWNISGAQNAWANNRIPLEELRLFSDVFTRIKSDYVEEVDDREVIEDAIEGMMNGLDAHSRYMRKKEYNKLKEGTTGNFGGVGIRFLMDEKRVRVISVIPGGPSEKAGLLPGDLITALDGKDVTAFDMQGAIEGMRGKIGTKVVFTVVRDGEPVFMVEVTRATIHVESIKTAMLTPHIGYFQITNFQNDSGQDLRQKMAKVYAENKDIRGMVLDLRNNPGGVLKSAVSVSDIFLKKDALVVYTKGRIEGSSTQFKTVTDDFSRGLPVIVLVNRGSASASEIVAGALQDHKRAVLMGSRSFGKGSVQTVHSLREDRAIRITTAKYYTPSGRSIHGKGVEPDIDIPLLSEEELKVLLAEQEKEPKVEPWKVTMVMRLQKDPTVKKAITEMQTMISNLSTAKN